MEHILKKHEDLSNILSNIHKQIMFSFIKKIDFNIIAKLAHEEIRAAAEIIKQTVDLGQKIKNEAILKIGTTEY